MSLLPRIHWYAKSVFSSPSPSAIPDTDALSVPPTCAVPSMVGAPVAGVFGGGSTGSVAALVRLSALPASSVKLTRTLIRSPSSALTSV